MKIEAQFFGQLKDVTRCVCCDVELHDGSNVQAALDAVYARFPGLDRWDGHVRMGIGVEYVERDAALRDGDRLAIMPPVQGG